MKIRKTILLGAILLGVSFGWSQPEKITGMVSSADDGANIPGVNVIIKGTTKGTTTDLNGKYQILASPGDILVFSFIGYATREIKVGSKKVINVFLTVDVSQLSEIVVTGAGVKIKKNYLGYAIRSQRSDKIAAEQDAYYPSYAPPEPQNWNTEEYSAIHENIFHNPIKTPLSTFSIDVDAASYSNIRRFLNNGQRPLKDAVRIEEMVNYFDYSYASPDGSAPFSVYSEVSIAPWNPAHRLVHIGIQGKKIATENLPASNLVFLLDVSGSMDSPNKLPLLKSAFRMLVEQLREEDHVAIVVYAGAAGVVLEPTSGSKKEQIMDALNRLQAGGSTAGGAGIKLAYSMAKKHFVKGGNNRVILATDGDFNIGQSSNAAMERLIEQERESGVFLTVLGFGTGNYKDSKMESIADKGNGNYAYIDNILEAKKVLVNEFGGTMFTIAKDVKIQVEFNPALVKEYRLIGYENRKLRDEDFNNDKKDAGELGSGHTVTALYEIVTVGSDEPGTGTIDPLKYQKNKANKIAKTSNEMMTVKLRYKEPDGKESKLISMVVLDRKIKLTNTSDNFRWSAAVAEFGLLLRDSEFKAGASYIEVQSLAKSALGDDPNGYRSEFIRLVNAGDLLALR